MATIRHPAHFTSIVRTLAIAAGALATTAFAGPAHAEPASCLSPDPAQWPAPSKPYFMLALDTSGSMTTGVGTASSCGFGSDRVAHARCAVRNTVLAFGGEVNFGLSTFAVLQDLCGAACYGTCQYYCFQQEINTRGFCSGCGPRPGSAATVPSRCRRP